MIHSSPLTLSSLKLNRFPFLKTHILPNVELWPTHTFSVLKKIGLILYGIEMVLESLILFYWCGLNRASVI